MRYIGFAQLIDGKPTACLLVGEELMKSCTSFSDILAAVRYAQKWESQCEAATDLLKNANKEMGK